MNIDALISEQVRAAVAEAIAPLLTVQRVAVRLAYTIREAAEVTGASVNHIRTAIRTGELHAKQAGEGKTGRYLIPADCLTAWLHGTPQPLPTTAQRKAR
jgi:excisionase family DNA binding protein